MDNLSPVMDMNCIFLCMRWGPHNVSIFKVYLWLLFRVMMMLGDDQVRGTGLGLVAGLLSSARVLGWRREAR